MIRRALVPVLGTSLMLLALGVIAGDRHRKLFRLFADCPYPRKSRSFDRSRARFKARSIAESTTSVSLATKDWRRP